MINTNKKDFVRILGPCSVQSEDIYLGTAKLLYPIMNGRDWYYKASFDKANRTSIYGGRGPGLDDSIRLFKKVKKLYPDIKLTTDVHEPWQCEKLAGIIDLVQIPAFLCKQTDLIIASAEHFDKMNIKKGQWLGPQNLIKSVDKIKSVNKNCEAWICDRGSNFGFDHLVTDLTIVDELKEAYDKVILDCTHSTQRSRKFHGTQGDPILGGRHFVGASVYNYDGIFAETHPVPAESCSDADCQIHVNRIQRLIEHQDAIIDTNLKYKDIHENNLGE
jgi:2-dehydro-3-deoxyphosphooctonate aldolase (KDO 8-P synthase)